MKISKILPCAFSLHSYLHSLGLGLLPSTHQGAEKQAELAAELSGPIRNMVERKNTSFFAYAHSASYIIQTEPGWLR